MDEVAVDSACMYMKYEIGRVSPKLQQVRPALKEQLQQSNPDRKDIQVA